MSKEFEQYRNLHIAMSDETRAEINNLKGDFKQHRVNNEKNFADLNKSINTIKDNHLKHLDDKVDKLDKTVGIIATDVTWLKKNQWYIVTTSIGSFLSVVIAVVLYFLTR